MVKGIKKFYEDNGPVYNMDHLFDFINEVKESGLPTVNKRKNKQVYKLFNVPCSFDIETTSMIYDGHKHAWMYIWMFGINGISIYGRTWDEFLYMLDELQECIGYSLEKRIVCYVHNLSFEYQFIRKYFKWFDVFASEERKPITATTTTGIEFRCSYQLTGVGLEKVGEDLLRYKCCKKVGDLCYNLIRGPKTPLDDKELGYCINDIRVVMNKIMECIEDEGGNIGYIPLTKTGYVRRYVKKAVHADKYSLKVVQSLKLSLEEYEMAEKAFMGGFTHANALRSNITQYNVVSYDFTSSYPAVMLSEKYPMSNGTRVVPKDVKEFYNYLTTKCCLFEILLENVKLKDGMGDCPLSSSKCSISGKKIIDNGRIRECDSALTVITECDFYTLRKFYNFDYSIGTMYVYNKSYLPKPIIEAILKFYNDKTKLKDVVGKEGDYQLGKSNLNSIFGMMVMKVIRDVITYDENGWCKRNANKEEQLEEYNNSKSRFNWFLWGVWITAYARKNLFTGIYECGSDYIYADTDSIKILNADKHDAYIIEYNRQITEKLEACLKYYELDSELIKPKTIENEEKPLGVWDFDGHYKEFKTIGAKRYMCLKDKDKTYYKGTEKEFTTPYTITVAGVSKIDGLKFIIDNFKNPFDGFNENLEIDKEHTGKLTHYYIDEEETVTFEDYLGVEDTITSKSSICLYKSEFKMHMDDYINLLSMLHSYNEILQIC